MATATKKQRGPGIGSRGRIPERPDKPVDPDTVYFPEEAAGYLAISLRQLRTITEEGRIGYLPVNKRGRRYTGRDILDFQDTERRKARR